MPIEKRSESRVFFDMPAEFTVDDTVYNVRQLANLSVGGCLLNVTDDLQEGAGCHLQILIEGHPMGVKVDATGLIVRNEPEAVAMKFTLIDQESLFHLKNIIKYSLPLLKYNPPDKALNG